MGKSFLKVAEQGIHYWWLHLLGMAISLGFWAIGWQITNRSIHHLVAQEAILKGDSLDSEFTGIQVQRIIQDSAILSYILTTAPFIFLCIGIFLVTRVLHHRKVLTLISADASFNQQRFLSGFLIWFLLACVQTSFEYGFTPHHFVWSLHPLQWLAFLPIALVLTPIQTSAEEFLFRSYFMQGLGLLIRQPLILAIAVSLPFALVHFSNPEMERGVLWIGLTYFAMAMFLALITLKDDRLELALGVHAANNLFIVLLVNTQDSALRSPSIILQTVPTDPRITLLALLLMMGAFYAIVFGRRGKGRVKS
jgi:membrane protease YdiL (CAAX protease family)